MIQVAVLVGLLLVDVPAEAKSALNQFQVPIRDMSVIGADWGFVAPNDFQDEARLMMGFRVGGKCVVGASDNIHGEPFAGSPRVIQFLAAKDTLVPIGLCR